MKLREKRIADAARELRVWAERQVRKEHDMRLKDVPPAPAYVVFHDAYMNGAMDVYPAESMEQATATAAQHRSRLEESGHDECGGWKAYEKLLRVKVYMYHGSNTPLPFRREIT